MQELTPDQASALAELGTQPGPFLLFGATGSGKTEVYLRCVQEMLMRDPSAQALVMVPEINLTPMLLERFTARFGADHVAAMHSGMTPAQRLKAWLAPRLDRSRRIQSQSLRGHVQLRLVAGMRRWRRSTRRHAHEMAHMQAWLYKVEQALKSDARLAVELLRCRRLIKGYSDTHARGTSRFDRLMAAVESLHGQSDAAAKLEQLRTAALKDAEGRALSERMAQLGLA